MISRRQFLTTLLGMGAGTVAVPSYARYIEPHWLRLVTRKVPLPPGRRAPGVRLLHLSDFHLSPVAPLPYIEEAIEMGLAEKPDLVCLTGDFQTGRLTEPEAYAAVLSRLPAAAPTFASLGNHDGGAWTKYRGGYPDSSTVRAFLADCGITCLHNASARVPIRGHSLTLVGLGDQWAAEFQPAPAFANVDPDMGGPVVVLSHNPDTKSALRAYPWDLMLCGHTHGGQFYLPFLGAPFAPVRDHRYVQGLRPWEGRLIHITHGVGNIGGIRFNCRPEVNILDLV